MQVTMLADDFLRYLIRNSIHTCYLASGPFSLPVDTMSLIEQLTGAQAENVTISFCKIARCTVLFSANLDVSETLAVAS